MDEELGVKAPVTRLRRRLSTEAEGVKSPLTPSTPTKKRSTRIAKPALELIDENVTESLPKKATRRTSTKDVEVMEEKPVTPARRSTRIRSNTSLLMEATQNIVADSPRAKRALRRNSQIGSDTESTSTPARRTRTRIDSTSSVEKLAVTGFNDKGIVQVTEAISEEPEKEISKDSSLNFSQNSTPLRKSPRLNKKGKNTTDEQQKDNNEKTEQNDNALTNPSKLIEDTSFSLNGLTSNTHNNISSKESEIQNLSLNSAKVINEIITNPKKSTDINKTVSEIEESSDDKGNRKRTKSWTTITANDTPSENINSPTKFASGDSIIEKIDIKSPNKSINKSASIYNTSLDNKENIHNLKSGQALNTSDTIKLLGNTPTKNIQSIVFMEDSDSNSSTGKLTIDIQNDREGEKNDGGDQCVPVVKQVTPKRLTSDSFVVEPMDIDETIPENVTFNDFSDKSNSSKEDNQESDLKQNSSQFNEKSSYVNKSPRKSTRTSSRSLEQGSDKSKRKSSIRASEENNDVEDALDKSSMSEKYNKSKRKSSLSKIDSNNDKRKSSTSSQVEEKVNESLNKSKRKSVSETESQNAENNNENKSTLVLSQLKDVSTNETSNSSKPSNDTNHELNKSVNIRKATDKTQSNYLTSTPLHQKPLQKLAMQINTSIISPNVESKNSSKANKSKTPVKIISNVSHDSDSSEESDDDSKDKSKMIDNEAEEASDDYESGDSRDAEEKQYEEDHEIMEKGETLESEPNSDDSDDSDYDKDSFLVSSNEEDEDLLSGSGDDLSLTDNELKMTSNSKKKYDERKRKEQKNASREMFEARHQLNGSSSKSKKSKGKKLESSSSESEVEAEIQSKKKNRLRIDSSQDVSMNNSDANDSVDAKNKKTKRLSASVCEDNPNEKEITIQNQSVVERNDPLSEAIKQEPKTPQKDFNMSTVLINDNIEQVQIDINATLANPNETTDPLQATLAQEDEESDSDISENMEIKENYDSVLEIRNKTNKKQNIKTVDTSLNLNKTPKDKIKQPIIDQLNLTQPKKSKKAKAQMTKDDTPKKTTNMNEADSVKKDDCDNSDSIDMRLLFPEDSNDSEVNDIKFKPDKNEEPDYEFIPLKKTEAKINLHESIGETNDTNVSFFIDTKGAFEDVDISIQNSGKKKKKKPEQNVSVANVAESNSLAPEETSLNNSLKKDKKKKKKNKSFDISQTVPDEEPVVNLLEISSRYDQSDFASKETANSSLNNEKKKKKNKSQLDVSQLTEDASEETPVNVSVKSEKKKKKNKSQQNFSQTIEDAPEETLVNVSVNNEKKNKSQQNVSQTIEHAPEETPVNISVNSEKKKKKNKSQLNVSQTIEDAPEETPVNVSVNNEKKNKSQQNVSQTIEHAPEETPVNISVNSEKKKKKNKSQQNVSQTIEDAPEETPVNVSVNSEKKKKKNKSQQNVSQTIEDAPEDTPVNVSVNSEKKKKKNKSQLDVSHTIEEAVIEETISLNVGKKKKNKSHNAHGIDENAVSEEREDTSKKREKKKKKIKPLDAFQTVDNAGAESDEAPLEVSFKREKKSDNPEPIDEDDTLNKSKNKFKKKKKKAKKNKPETDMNTDQDEVKAKKRKHDQSIDVAGAEIQLSKGKKKKKFSQNDEGDNPSQGGNTMKSNKRKLADDECHKNLKAFKGNFFEKIHVPRLPDSIVNQLDDQPALHQPKSKKSRKESGKAISTLPFIVDEGKTRKNKPSNYLEQSIYLNDSISPVQQNKKIKFPKVLPFTPTVVTSGTGYTSKFKINVLPHETEFVARAPNRANFREKYLAKQKAKKIRVEKYKKQGKETLDKF